MFAIYRSYFIKCAFLVSGIFCYLMYEQITTAQSNPPGASNKVIVERSISVNSQFNALEINEKVSVELDWQLQTGNNLATSAYSVTVFLDPAAEFVKITSLTGTPLAEIPINPPPQQIQQQRTARQVDISSLVFNANQNSPSSPLTFLVSYTLPQNSQAQSSLVSQLDAQAARFSSLAWGDQASITVTLPVGWELWGVSSGANAVKVIANSSNINSLGQSNQTLVLATRADFVAVQVTTHTISSIIAEIPANPVFNLPKREVEFAFDFWQLDAASRTQIAQQAAIALGYIETFAGVAYPGPSKIIIREVGPAESKGLGTDYAPRWADAFDWNGDKSSPALIRQAQPNQNLAASLYNALAHSWLPKSRYKSAWLREGLAEYYARTALMQLNLPYLPDKVYKEARLRTSAQKTPPLDKWQPLDSLTGLTQAIIETEQDLYLSATFFYFNLLSENGNSTTLLPTALERTIYLPMTSNIVTSREWLDALEEAGSQSLDDLFTSYIFAANEQPLIAARRLLWDEIKTFAPIAQKQNLSLSGLLIWELKRWDFTATRRELDAGQEMLNKLDEMRQLANSLQNSGIKLTLPPRLDNLLEELHKTQNLGRLPRNQFEQDYFSYPYSLEFVKQTNQALQDFIGAYTFALMLPRSSEQYKTANEFLVMALDALRINEPQLAQQRARQVTGSAEQPGRRLAITVPDEGVINRYNLQYFILCALITLIAFVILAVALILAGQTNKLKN